MREQSLFDPACEFFSRLLADGFSPPGVLQTSGSPWVDDGSRIEPFGCAKTSARLRTEAEPWCDWLVQPPYTDVFEHYRAARIVCLKCKGAFV